MFYEEQTITSAETSVYVNEAHDWKSVKKG